MLKTIFLGTPSLAVPFLELVHARTQVSAVITTPDQPAGRGYEVKASSVKVAALKLALPVHQPTSVKDATAANLFGHFGADVGVVVAYGKLLPPEVLGSTKLGFLNVHFSLL